MPKSPFGTTKRIRLFSTSKMSWMQLDMKMEIFHSSTELVTL